MMSSTKHIWNFQTIYDALMLEIEPELTSELWPTLGDRYLGESVRERDLRMERYAQAFLEFDRRVQRLSNVWKDRLKIIQRTFLHPTEEEWTLLNAL